MGSNLDEYEDLDDLLEDASKLDEESPSEKVQRGETAKGPIGKNDSEMAEMIEDLQGDFAKLMRENGSGDSAEDSKTAEDFKKLLTALGKAGSTPQASENASTNSATPGQNGFKDIVSNTLERLKENGTKVDTHLMEEKKKGSSDDILSQLLGQLVDGADGDDEEGVENAIQSMLNQMSSKEVLYQPMKDMQTEFGSWMAANETLEEHADKIECYREQFALVNKIVGIYETEVYEDSAARDEIGELLDRLEQLGDSPVSKGFNSPDNAADLSKLLEMDGNENAGDLDKELQDTCQQQ
ncbi:LAME_0E07932g1_1 [Lachancea meyersii CBS 8951]|uniref:LAME_0E07932g1_1 n=1 Tax=Lachancea meyersii CBS 8951 TaxID=1266667 RepID=A0A1G4JIL5_9SACH|nr:LAME_0E07932g1_1 [Lachancea meyersii CBS 8951]